MENGIFKYIFRYSKNQQVFLLVLTMLSFPFLYVSYEVPKIIIDEAIGGSLFPKSFLGFEFEQLPYLWVLCTIFLALVFFNGGFKFFINVYRGVVGERMLRRLRYQLISRVIRFPLLHFRTISQGEIVSMVTAETEPLGGFFGDALSLPAFQGGTLLTLLVFMLVQDPILGGAAIMLYPIQAWLIPKLQRQVNRLAKERVRNVRKLSERLGELVSGVPDIHAHDTAQYELSDFSHRLGAIFDVRYQIYRKKFLIKFLNNFIAQLTPFFFFSIGGYLVINGSLTFGALTAILIAYKDLAGPWKELLSYYQRMEDARIKYDQLVDQFQPPDMFDEHLLEPRREAEETIDGPLVASNLSLEVDEGNRVVDGASFQFGTSEHVALVGPGGLDKSALAQLLARLVKPSGGNISIGDKSLAALPEAVTGRRLSYVDQEAYIRSGTIRDVLLYGLKHHPMRDAEGDEEALDERQKRIQEASLSGNSPFDIADDWIDYGAADATTPGELTGSLIRALGAVGLEDDVFELGLRRIVDPGDYPALTEGVLEARSAAAGRLRDPALAGLVEPFDTERFNSNASVAENILFGTPVDATFDIETLGANSHVLGVLDKVGLAGRFLEIGRSVAALMVELFRDLPPGHEFFERFGFIDADDLPEFQRILNHAATLGLDGLEEADRARLTDLPFKLIPARHRIEMIDDEIQQRLLEARRVFAQTLPDDLRSSIAFFEADSYNTASSIQDNILFGKIAGDKAESATRIGELLAEVIDELGLRQAVLEVGLDFNVGIAGKRLSAAQRHKLAIARCLVKRPQLLIFNQAAAALDASSQADMLDNVRREMKDRGLIWIDNAITEDADFDRVLEVERGKVTEQTARQPAPRPAATTEGPQAEAPSTEPQEITGGLSEETALLAEIPFFAGIERSKLKLLAFTSQRQVFEPEQYLINQGDMADAAYMIVEGSVEIIVNTSLGLKTVATLRRGDLIGELALLCDAPRTASVKACEKVSVLSIAKDTFLTLIQDNNEVSFSLTRILANRFETMMRTFGGGHALYDETTGLPNRDLLKDRLKHMAVADKREGKVSALIVIKLEDLAAKFDGGDQAIVDQLLKDIALRLRNCLREADTLARLEGFGFGIIANASTSNVDAEIVTQRIAKAMADPFTAGSKKIYLKEGFNFETYPLTEENLSLADEIL